MCQVHRKVNYMLFCSFKKNLWPNQLNLQSLKIRQKDRGTFYSVPNGFNKQKKYKPLKSANNIVKLKLMTKYKTIDLKILIVYIKTIYFYVCCKLCIYAYKFFVHHLSWEWVGAKVYIWCDLLVLFIRLVEISLRNHSRTTMNSAVEFEQSCNNVGWWQQKLHHWLTTL